MLTPERIREIWENYSPTKGIESFARSVESAALEATAKNAFEAMPHDIPQRMKDTICEETGWSGSMASRMYTELRKAFTGEPYKANEDLDAALLEVARLRKDAERYAVVRRGQHWSVIDGIGDPLTGDRLDAGIDAVIAEKGKP